MPTTEPTAKKVTGESTGLPIIEVEVPADTTAEAKKIANQRGIPIEDGLSRLTVFDYPTEALDGEDDANDQS